MKLENLRTYKVILPLSAYAIDTECTTLKDAKYFLKHIHLKVGKLPSGIQYFK